MFIVLGNSENLVIGFIALSYVQYYCVLQTMEIKIVSFVFVLIVLS